MVEGSREIVLRDVHLDNQSSHFLNGISYRARQFQLLFYLVRCCSNDRLNARNDLDRVFAASVLSCCLSNELSPLNRGGFLRWNCVNRVRELRCQFNASARFTRLKDSWPSLRRSSGRERPFHLKEFPPVMQSAHLGRIEKNARFVILNECIAIPAVPKTLDYRANSSARS